MLCSGSKVIALDEDMKCKVVKLYIQFKFIFMRKGITRLLIQKFLKLTHGCNYFCMSNSLFIQLKYVGCCIK